MIEVRCTVRGCGATIPAVAARGAPCGGRRGRPRAARPLRALLRHRAQRLHQPAAAAGQALAGPGRRGRGRRGAPAAARCRRRRRPAGGAGGGDRRPRRCRPGRARSTSARERVRCSALSPRGSACEAAGVDLSARAADLAARRHPGVLWLVANADRGLPFADGSLDLVLSITARRSPAECARVLAPGGHLVVAVPAPDDLAELREAVLGSASREDRAAKLVEEHAGHFRLLGRREARERRAFSARSTRGPAGRHLPRRPGRAARARERISAASRSP